MDLRNANGFSEDCGSFNPKNRLILENLEHYLNVFIEKYAAIFASECDVNYVAPTKLFDGKKIILSRDESEVVFTNDGTCAVTIAQSEIFPEELVAFIKKQFKLRNVTVELGHKKCSVFRNIKPYISFKCTEDALDILSLPPSDVILRSENQNRNIYKTGHSWIANSFEHTNRISETTEYFSENALPARFENSNAIGNSEDYRPSILELFEDKYGADPTFRENVRKMVFLCFVGVVLFGVLL